MHERAVAKINTDMRGVLALLIEKYQIAFAQCVFLHLTPDVALASRVARQFHAGFAKAVVHQTAAIEAARRFAAEAIGLAEHLQGVVGGVRRRGRARGLAGAGGQ